MLIHKLRTMPSKIVVGCRVSAKIGPLLPVHSTSGTGRSRRDRQVLHGTVVDSCPASKWRVHWDEFDKTSDHLSRNLSFLSNAGQANLNQRLLNMWKRNKQFYIGSHSDMLKYTRD